MLRYAYPFAELAFIPSLSSHGYSPSAFCRELSDRHPLAFGATGMEDSILPRDGGRSLSLHLTFLQLNPLAAWFQ